MLSCNHKHILSLFFLTWPLQVPKVIGKAPQHPQVVGEASEVLQRMSNGEQVQYVQQQIENVLRKVSEMEEREKEARDQEKVQYLRNQLEQLYKERVILRETENLPLRAQQGGEHNLSVTTRL